MSGAGRPSDKLLASLSESLALLQDYADRSDNPELMQGEALPSLLDQCAALAADPPGPEPLRVLHHMACTGGSLISRCLAAMPNVVLLSEIDPLSPLALPKRGQIPRFEPSDLIYAARVGPRPADAATIVRVFRAALAEMQAAFEEQGRHLCLRDHAHSQFCTAGDPLARPSLREMLEGLERPVRGIVTVRHPVDSFLSLRRNDWVHFAPATIDEYARRYGLFLDRHAGLGILRYEDFVADPEAGLVRLCDALALPYVAGAESFLPAIAVSGDSGRRSDRIAPRDRRPLPEDMTGDLAESAALGALCERLGYAL